MINLEDFWQDLLASGLQKDEYWGEKIFDTSCKIHLALMVEPYLSLILSRRKTIESRFSTKKIIPFNNISKGDIVILKKSGGSLAAVFEAGDVYFKRIERAEDFENIRKDYGASLCLEDEFWEKKKDAKYVSMIRITHLREISSIAIKKANRQSWLTYTRNDNSTTANNNPE